MNPEKELLVVAAFLDVNPQHLVDFNCLAQNLPKVSVCECALRHQANLQKFLRQWTKEAKIDVNEGAESAQILPKVFSVNLESPFKEYRCLTFTLQSWVDPPHHLIMVVIKANESINNFALKTATMRILTYFGRGSIIVQPTSCSPGVDSTK